MICLLSAALTTKALAAPYDGYSMLVTRSCIICHSRAEAAAIPSLVTQAGFMTTSVKVLVGRYDWVTFRKHVALDYTAACQEETHYHR